MKGLNFQEVLYFLVGFMCGFVLFALFWQSYQAVIYQQSKRVEKINHQALNITTNEQRYEHTLADKLFEEVRILCWVFTHPDNHEKKVPHVMKTWGKKCNKLLFMSVKKDPKNPEIVEIPIENGRDHLWNKTKLTMEYVYKNHLDDADWFMRADDDNFILMENLRYMLYQYHHQTSLYIGCRFAIKYPGVQEGYMAGGGHIFSKKALIKFNEISIHNDSLCPQADSSLDDVFVGKCLKNLAIFLDGRDERNQKRFFPLSPEQHFEKALDPKFWYSEYLWRNTTQGGLDCCSDTFVSKHYTSPSEMHALQYFIYNVHPFGLQKNLTEILPKKLSIDELIKLSDEKSFASNYQEHTRIHIIDDDERYRR